MSYVVLITETIKGNSVVGNFETREQAIGWAYNKYGPANTFGSPTKWKALPVVSPTHGSED